MFFCVVDIVLCKDFMMMMMVVVLVAVVYGGKKRCIRFILISKTAS